jgi:hypothetical protein
MRWSDIPWQPPTRTLRGFGAILAVLLGLLAWRSFAADRTTISVLLALSAGIIIFLAAARPQLLRPVFLGAMIVTFPIGWLVSRLVLAVLFYGLFTPIGLAFKLMGRDPLCRRKPEVDTYWTPKPMPAEVRSYFRQF